MTTPELLDFSRARVLVVGDVMLDRYWHGKVTRVSPEAPVPIMQVDDERVDKPGGAANVACNLAALGATPILCGITANDAAGDTLRTLMARMDVRCEWQTAERGATVTKLRLVGNRQQQLMRLDFERPIAASDADALTERALARMGDVDLLLLSDYGKGTLRRPDTLIDAARARGLPALVDPKGADFSRYRRATLLTPNRQELENAVGACPDEATLHARARALIDTLELERLLVTRGAEGATLFSRHAATQQVVAEPSEVFDITGAGDTVIAVVGAALAAGLEIGSAVQLANTAASLVVEHQGAAAVSVAELQARIARRAAETSES